MDLRLTLERLDREHGLALLRHHRQDVGDDPARITRTHDLAGKPRAHALDAAQPPQARQLARDDRAGTGNTCGNGDGSQ